MPIFRKASLYKRGYSPDKAVLLLVEAGLSDFTALTACCFEAGVTPFFVEAKPSEALVADLVVEDLALGGMA